MQLRPRAGVCSSRRKPLHLGLRDSASMRKTDVLCYPQRSIKWAHQFETLLRLRAGAALGAPVRRLLSRSLLRLLTLSFSSTQVVLKDFAKYLQDLFLDKNVDAYVMGNEARRVYGTLFHGMKGRPYVWFTFQCRSLAHLILLLCSELCDQTFSWMMQVMCVRGVFACF